MLHLHSGCDIKRRFRCFVADPIIKLFAILGFCMKVDLRNAVGTIDL